MYIRGFVLSQDPIEIPGFVGFPIEGAYFAHHPALQVRRIGRTILAGRAINVTGAELSIENLDDICGRFIWIELDPIRIRNDAGGMQAVFYAVDRPIVASHVRLIGGTPSREERLRRKGTNYKFAWPGAATPYAGVYMLTPNTLLEFPENRVKRYFPEHDLEPVTVSDAANIVLAAMKFQMRHIGREVVVSLTAGMDSRLTLTACRNSRAKFVTYRKPGDASHDVDVSVAKEIAARYELDHRVFEITNETTAEFTELARQTTFYSHIRSMAFLYSKAFGQDWLHIRSNLAEIGRAFYRAKTEREPMRSGVDMARTWNPKLAGQQIVQNAFNEFHATIQFDSICNYDPYDLFYWEHRMGCWHSHVVLESDLAFDTHVLFNCRRILKAMLSLSLQDRIAATLFHNLIRSELPELADIPINPTVWPR